MWFIDTSAAAEAPVLRALPMWMNLAIESAISMWLKDSLSDSMFKDTMCFIVFHSFLFVVFLFLQLLAFVFVLYSLYLILFPLFSFLYLYGFFIFLMCALPL